MVRDYQKSKVRDELTHADFILVDLSKDVRAVVPIVLVGKSEGVKLGGIMHQVIHKLDISCRPDRIPIKIEVDVTKLGMNESFHVSDVKMPEGVKAVADEVQAGCAGRAPKAEKEEAPAAAEGAAAEGAPAAAGAAGAAPAAGAAGAAPAAGAAKAAPAKEEKKGKKE